MHDDWTLPNRLEIKPTDYLISQDLCCCIFQQVHDMRFHLIERLVQALFESDKIHRGLFKLRLKDKKL